MFYESDIQQASSFRKIGFSEKVWRCLAKADQKKARLNFEDRREVFRLLDQARDTLDIATNEVIEDLLNKNPSVIQVSNPDSGKSGLLAMLPLNELGMAALLQGRFDGRSPEKGWICAPGESSAALYIWLVYMPGSFGHLLSAIASAIDPMAPVPCPMFSRSTNLHSSRLHKAAGFKPAREYYPNCNPDILVVFPEASIKKPSKPEPEVRIARTIDDILKVFSVRSATYLAEQFCLYEEEFDGNDFCSTHFLGLIDGDAAGCVRLRFFEGFAKLERLAVRAEYRNSRLAYQLVRAALAHCQAKGYGKVLGHSRLDLVRFWKIFGFRPIDGKPEFTFANIRYAEIMLEQEVSGCRIGLDADPMIILRPEGAWDVPGPFDLAPTANDPYRKKLIQERTRTIGQRQIAT